MNAERERWAHLSDAAFRVLRESGTEPPGTSPLLHEHRAGIYACEGCGQPVFESGAKFESGCGWPSFDAPAGADALTLHRDLSHGMVRTEIRCSGCDGHLGHVFPDGPTSTGLRFCLNGVALHFEPQG
jgi:peptide-methionine (R)-S-oxide reductase